jgi:purine nucleosidase
MKKVILDTDIGDDIDDALALGLILASPEMELLGVTTVFKNVVARAAQARSILKAAGRPEVPVAAGCGAVMSPRVAYPSDARRAYLEGELPNQHAMSLPEADLAPLDSRHGVDFLIDTVMASAGDITIVTIGAMTNLAMAMVKEPRILGRIPRIVSMAAAFDRQESEWNIRCDPVAAAVVLGSGVPMRIVGLDVTMRVQFRRKDIEALKASLRPLAGALARSIAAWEAHSGWAHLVQGLPIMHDPLAVATILDPTVVQWRRGTATVELQGEQTYGYTLFQNDDKGPHEYAYQVDAEAALNLWIRQVLAY